MAASITADQRRLVEWLDEEFDGPRLHRLDGHGHVGVAGEEDDRHVRAAGELPLQFETAQPGKGQVEDHTARDRAPRVRQEVLRRREGSGSQPAVLMSRSSDWRTAMSPSTMKTMGATSSMPGRGDGCRCDVVPAVAA